MLPLAIQANSQKGFLFLSKLTEIRLVTDPMILLQWDEPAKWMKRVRTGQPFLNSLRDKWEKREYIERGFLRESNLTRREAMRSNEEWWRAIERDMVQWSRWRNGQKATESHEQNTKFWWVFWYEVWAVPRGDNVMIFCSMYMGFYSERYKISRESAAGRLQARNKGIREIDWVKS
jgi:hypothetical protein